jgi:hypothetical protein
MNTLQTLITNTMSARSLTKAQIVSLLGFNNTAKGIRRLNALLEGGTDSSGMLDRLPGALELPTDVVRAAYEQTLAQKRAEVETQRAALRDRLRAAFRPHIHVQTDRTVPQPIFVVAMAGGPDRWLRIDLPEGMTTWPEQSQIEHVAEMVRQHYRQCTGSAGPFGNITGYYFRRDFDQAVEFSIAGQLIGRHIGQFVVGTCWLSV